METKPRLKQKSGKQKDYNITKYKVTKLLKWLNHLLRVKMSKCLSFIVNICRTYF